MTNELVARFTINTYDFKLNLVTSSGRTRKVNGTLEATRKA